MNFGNQKADDKDETEEKSKDAKKNVKIDMLKSKGYSERDAIMKGSKEDSPEDETTPSEEMSDKDINELGEESEGPSIELKEDELGSSPEIGSTITLTATAQVMGVYMKDDGSKCFELKLSGISSNSDGPAEEVEVAEEAPAEGKDVPENEV